MAHLYRQKDRLSLLQAAIDQGFSHFDTAPYYGFGMAERDLGYVLKQYPHITVTTKVGLYSPGGEFQSSMGIYLRKGLGKVYAPLSTPAIDFSLKRAQKSLEGSLQRLRRERIELFLLHEPEIALLNSDEWQRWLQDRQAAGQIQYFGLASVGSKIQPFLNSAAGLASVIQMADSLERKEADLLVPYHKKIQLTYGYVSASLAAGSQMSIDTILRQALVRNADGAIVVTTNKQSRLLQYSKILEKHD